MANVFVNFFVNDEPSLSVRVAGETSCAQVREHWLSFAQESTSFLFAVDAVDGPVLPEEGSLRELFPRRKVLVVHAVRAEVKSVRVLGARLEPASIELLPQESTQDLTERVKALFGVDEGRTARLLAGGRVLEEEASPYLQAEGCPLLELDLEVRIAAAFLEAAAFVPEAFDASGRFRVNKDLPDELRRHGMAPRDACAVPAFEQPVRRQPLRVFASEAVLTLAGPGVWRARAFNSDHVVASSEPVHALVSPEALLSGAKTGVVLERRLEVRIDETLQRRSRTTHVWPLTKLGDLAGNPRDSVLLEGQPLDPQQSVWEAGLQEGASLCVTRVLPLCVFDAQGAVTKLTANLGETLADLRERLSLPEEEFEVWADGQLLRDMERSLLRLDLDATSVLLARPRCRAVVLTARGAEPVRMAAVRKNASFHDFLQAAADALRMKLSPRTRFVCACGRTFSDDEGRRQLPKQCCDAAELRFAVEHPGHSRKNQTSWRKKKTASDALPVSLQTDREAGRAVCQTGGEVGHSALQTGGKVGRSVLQTGGRGVAKFRIVWGAGGREAADLDVPFLGAPTGRELREAVAEASGERASDLRLEQWTGKWGEAMVVEVKGGGYSNEFGEKAQGWWFGIATREPHEIRDEEEVRTAGPRRAAISVFRK